MPRVRHLSIKGAIAMQVNGPDGKDQEIRRLRQLLIEANGIIRSFHAVCDRDGEKTNWDALGRQVKEVLATQHQYLHPEQYVGPRAG